LFVQAISVATAKLGPAHPDTPYYHSQYGMCPADMKRYDDAQRELLMALRLQQPRLQKQDANAIATINSLAKLYQIQRKPDRAEAMKTLLATTQPTTHPAALANIRAGGE